MTSIFQSFRKLGPLGFTAALTVSIIAPLTVYFVINKYVKNNNKQINYSNDSNDITNPPRKVLILYGTVSGTTKSLAVRLYNLIDSSLNKIPNNNVSLTIMDVMEYDEDKLLSKEDIVLFLCCTWTDGKPPEAALQFVDWIQDMAVDFRVSKDCLSKIKFACFGLGGAGYGSNFGKPVKDVHHYFTELGASPLLLPMLGDDQSDLESKFTAWSIAIGSIVYESIKPVIKSSCCSDNDNSGNVSCCNDGNENNSGDCCSSNSYDEKLYNGHSAGLTKAEYKQIKRSSTNNVKSKVHLNKNATNKFQEQQKLVALERSAEDDVSVIDEEEEEDRINQLYVQMDSDEEEDGVKLWKKDTLSIDGGGCETDLEDIGSRSYLFINFNLYLIYLISQ
jgi:sulfite reductase alpha subunit-like flavoprotein